MTGNEEGRPGQGAPRKLAAKLASEDHDTPDPSTTTANDIASARRLRQENTPERSDDVNPSNPALATQAAALLARTRSAQGLPPTVTDPTAIRRVGEVLRPPSTNELGHRARRKAVAR